MCTGLVAILCHAHTQRERERERERERPVVACTVVIKPSTMPNSWCTTWKIWSNMDLLSMPVGSLGSVKTPILSYTNKRFIFKKQKRHRTWELLQESNYAWGKWFKYTDQIMRYWMWEAQLVNSSIVNYRLLSVTANISLNNPDTARSWTANECHNIRNVTRSIY